MFFLKIYLSFICFPEIESKHKIFHNTFSLFSVLGAQKDVYLFMIKK